jgi:hypothetical protein
MTDPQHEDIPEDAHEPATKGDLHRLRGEIASKMATMQEEIVRHFDVAVENIEESLRGANADEIDTLRDADRSLHERLTPLEQRAGISSPHPPHQPPF